MIRFEVRLSGFFPRKGGGWGGGGYMKRLSLTTMSGEISNNFDFQGWKFRSIIFFFLTKYCFLSIESQLTDYSFRVCLENLNVLPI